ncbi:U3 small nucleolar RNA-associated protein 5 [Erysiphe neolycopersici]|uniref:U3 small nucleolar RNA-associated protein 5 n=1 Tax=Erysiphe neolycopersici TaxID=212602 RepID=A0A420I6H0_9PEZI|nr:U3 small nucleolar RNA-associated protein 5 [Erysiphe neolycopersici]
MKSNSKDQEINTEVEQDKENLADANTRIGDSVPEAAESPSELTFGDLVRANIPEVIDVASAFDTVGSLVKNDLKASIQPPPGASLGSVLSQALRTNDIALLETCFHTSDISTIRATIQRLESCLAAKLLQKLAERLHKRPGIAGKLMVWVQWTLIAHGGYLAAQRGLVQSLSELTKVMDERSQGLKSVLLLKGKLDMIEAQIEMRRSIHSYRGRMDEEDHDDSIIYVEGQENDGPGAKEFVKGSVDEIMNDALSEESDLSEEMPTMNGTITDSEVEDQYSSDDDSLIDDEARDSNSEILPFYNT